MPLVASFEDVDQLGWYVLGAAFLFLTWVASVLMALVAAVSFFRQRARQVVWRWARRCMLASIPVGLLDVWLLLMSTGQTDPAAVCAILIITLAPLVLAACVSYLASRSGRKDGGPIHDG